MLVTVDASLLAKLRFPEELSDKAAEIYDAWVRGKVSICAPQLIFYELVSTANKKVVAGSVSLEQAELAMEYFLTEPLEVVTSDSLYREALRIAQRLTLRSTYDAHYLAVAEDLDCEFWTADERLYNGVRDRFPLIRWLGAS